MFCSLRHTIKTHTGHVTTSDWLYGSPPVQECMHAGVIDLAKFGMYHQDIAVNQLVPELFPTFDT